MDEFLQDLPRDDLTLPPGTGELDDLLCGLAQLSREVRARLQRLPAPATLTAAQRQALIENGQHLLRALNPLIEGFNDGSLRADQADAAAQRAALERDRLIVEVREQLIYLHSNTPPDVWSILGWKDGIPVALGRGGGLVGMAQGIQGAGKTVLSTNVVEGVLSPRRGITSEAHVDTAVLSFSAVPGALYLADLLAGVSKNPNPAQLEELARRLGASGAPIEKITLVVPRWQLEDYQDKAAHLMDRGLRVVPLGLRLPQLALPGLEPFLASAGDASYVQEMLELAQEQGEGLTMESWLKVIRDTEDLNSTQKRAARRRLKLLSRLAEAEGDLWSLVEAGTATVFSLGGPWVSAQDVLPMVTALINAYSMPCPGRAPFQRVFLMDEVNRFDSEPQVWEQLVSTGRLIRHRGSMLLLLGQDFLKIPDAFWNLVGWFSLFRQRCPTAFGHARSKLAGYKRVSFEMACNLEPGAAYVAVSDSTDPAWRGDAQKVNYRHLCCEHGGHTKQVY